MNIVGAIIFIGIGIIIITKVYKLLKYDEDTDYTKYPVAIGTVLGTEFDERWIVSFIDKTGEEVLGMDDFLACSTFFKDKYSLPKRRTKEKVYYWKYEENSQYSINHKEIKYYIHFCNEDMYELAKKQNKRELIIFVFIGLAFIVSGVIIFYQ